MRRTIVIERDLINIEKSIANRTFRNAKRKSTVQDSLKKYERYLMIQTCEVYESHEKEISN